MQNNIAAGKGIVSNIQRFSIQDGPGIRTTVFLKGCPLRCLWCSNPESMRLSPEIITRDIRCVRSGKCAEICPKQAIAFVEKTRVIDWERCNYCMKCAQVCPSKAIEAVGELMTIAEVIDTVGRDSNYYRRTNGGMTLSGGEPLLQWQFALGLLREARKKGFHTALDTAGYAEWEILDEVLNHTDLVLYDVKHMDSEKHQEATGVSNERILDNLHKTLAKSKAKVWIRRPVIPSFNDSDEDLAKLCKFVLTLDRPVEKISLLPYHKYGELKYAAMGRAYPYQDVALISDEQMGRSKKLVESYGLKAEIGR